MGRRLVCAGTALAAVLAGCGSSSSSAAFTAASLLLAPSQLPDYTRTHQDPLSAEQIAGEAGDVSAADRITGQGLADAARATYQPRVDGTRTFEQVVSEVLVFHDPAGAAAFFTDEQQRRARNPEGGGSVTVVPGVTPHGVDALAAFDAHIPPQSSGGAPLEAFLFVMRRGAAVAELLTSGPAGTATLTRAQPLLADQESLLSAVPG